MISIVASLTRWRKPQDSNTQILIFSSVAITDSRFVPQPPALPITSFSDMASNASTRLNALDSGNNVQSETVDLDMADRIVGAIKGGFAGGFGGVLVVAVASSPVGWTVVFFGAAMGAARGAARGFITKAYPERTWAVRPAVRSAVPQDMWLPTFI